MRVGLTYAFGLTEIAWCVQQTGRTSIMSAGESKQADNVESIKSDLRQAVRQLSELSRSDATFDEFTQEILVQLVKLTGAHGALLWQSPGSGGLPRITHKSGSPDFKLAIDDQLHRNIVVEVIEKQQPLGIDSETLRGSSGIGLVSVSTQCLLLFTPVFNRSRDCCGSLELLQRYDISSSAREGYLKFLDRIAELFQRWHEHHDLERLSHNADLLATTLDYVSEVHRSIDFKETAFAIANESRRLLRCDRVSFARWNGSACKVIAVSSQDRFDNRANVIRKLGKLASASVSSNVPLWITGDTSGLAPEMIKRINDYLDESHCRTLAVIPLLKVPEQTAQLEFDPRKRLAPVRLGALIVEFFDADVPEAKIADQIALVRNHAQLASRNALEHDQIFLRPLWKRLGEVNSFLFRDHYAKSLTALAALALLAMFLIFYPAELKMRVNGVMQPTERRNIFAKTEGVANNVFVDQGDVVEAGATLIELENPDLDIRIEETNGQLKIVNQKLQETGTQVGRSGPRENEDSIALWGQIPQLESQQANLKKRLDLMHSKKAMQTITSPIAGTVVTWDAKKRLTDLPISTNQYVLSIADFKGQWQAELRIPQNQVGYVVDAIEKNDGEDLDVEFRIATNPNLLVKGKLVRLADRTDLGQSGVPEFRAIVDADISEIQDLRPGAGLTAKIHCGRRPLGFVWFYQVIDFLRTRVFF